MLWESFATFHERLVIYHHKTLDKRQVQKSFIPNASNQFANEEEALIYKRRAQQPLQYNNIIS